MDLVYIPPVVCQWHAWTGRATPALGY